MKKFILVLILLTLLLTTTALAQWAPPTYSPPNPGSFAVPLNTGIVPQTKTGDLSVSGAGGFWNGLGLFLGGLRLNISQVSGAPGGAPATGSVLQSADALGNAQWVPLSTLGFATTTASGYWTRTTTVLSPTTVGDQIKITGGSPGLGKVLTSDATGLAVECTHQQWLAHLCGNNSRFL